MKRAYRLFILISILGFLIACGGGSAPPKLEQGIRVITSMLQPRNLSRSMYAAAFPKGGSASEFVSYIFSDIGAAEWPDHESMGDPEQARAIGIPLSPSGVSFVPLEPDPTLENEMQIVVKADEKKDIVIIEAYTDPTKEPIKVVKRKVPKVEAAPGVKEMLQSNLQTGATYQKF